MKFMNEEGNIVEGTPISEIQIAALDFLRKGLENDKYQHLGIKFIDSHTREVILKFVAKNFDIKRTTTYPEPSQVVDEVKF